MGKFEDESDSDDELDRWRGELDFDVKEDIGGELFVLVSAIPHFEQDVARLERLLEPRDSNFYNQEYEVLGPLNLSTEQVRSRNYNTLFETETIIHCGIDLQIGVVATYNSDNRKVSNISIEKVETLDVKNIDNMYKDLITKVKHILGCAIITLNSSYKNETRKQFIEIGKNYGFMHIQIIDKCSTKCLSMLSPVIDEIKVEDGNIIWIIYSKYNFLTWDVWESKNQKIYLLKTGVITDETKPNIVLCASDEEYKEFNKKKYNNVKIKCVNNFSNIYAALIDACLIAGVYTKLAVQPVLDRDVYFGISATQKLNLNPSNLPLRKIIKIYKPEEFFMYDDLLNKKIVKLRGDTDYIVTIDIDSSGIFSYKYAPSQDSAKNPDGEKWFDDFIRGRDNPKTYVIQRKAADSNENIKAVGIDFGNSNCSVAVKRRNGIETVAIENTGGRLMPSYVAYDETNEKCGQICIERLIHKAEFTVFDIKRILGNKFEFIIPYSDWTFNIIPNAEDNGALIQCQSPKGLVTKKPNEVTAVLLKHIKNKVEEFQGEKMDEIVITVPGTSTEYQINSIVDSAKLAGYSEIEIISEPVAAIFAYLYNKNISKKNFTGLLFDLGGGNLNVWLFEVKNGELIMINNDGDTCLGGRNFDNLLFNHLLCRLTYQFNVEMETRRKYKLMFECMEIKHSLSVQNNKEIFIDDYKLDATERITISQSNFEMLAYELLFKIKTIVNKTLSDVDYTYSKIDMVFPVGGSSRMPMIDKMLKEMFPKAEHYIDRNPDEIVAIGAACYAYEKIKEAQKLTEKNNIFTSYLKNRVDNSLNAFLNYLKNLMGKE